MKNQLTFKQGISGNDFIEEKRTYVFELNNKRIYFRFGLYWNSDLFIRLCRFKLKKHFGY